MPFPVTVHPFTSPTEGSCAYERGLQNAPNALVLIGGLTAGPHSADAAFVDRIADGIATKGYGVWEFRMRSSYDGFGYSSVKNDAEDLAALVGYLRSLGKDKIVVMGCSTGCQDCMEYTDRSGGDRPRVDGYVLQAPASDRESAGIFMPQEEIERVLAVAEGMIKDGKGTEAMPRTDIPEIFAGPVTAYRWWSLVAVGGDDDYFSSDLPDSTLQKKFGRVDAPILITPGENDEMVPPTVDKEALLKRWTSFVPEGRASRLSGMVPGGDHQLTGKGSQEWFVERLVGFIGKI